MKLTDVDAPSISPPSSLPLGDVDSSDSIRIARLPRKRAASQTESPPPLNFDPPPSEAPWIPKPPALRFIAARRTHVSVQARAALAVVLVMAASVWVLADSETSHRPTRVPKPAVRLSPAGQRVAAAARARAAAIAQAKRDRGTDAELQDTIPAATPLPIRHPGRRTATHAAPAA